MNRISDTSILASDGASNRLYWACQIGGWSLYCVIAFYLSAPGSTAKESFNLVLIKLWIFFTGISLTHGWRHFLRQRGWLDRNRAFPFFGVFVGLVILCLAQTAIVFLAYFVLRRDSLDKDVAGMQYIVLVYFFVFLMWTLIYSVVLTRRRAVRFEMEKWQLEVSMKEAELRALQAQVNPHFFFNSLNSIRALIYQDVDVAAEAVGKLAGMMRYSLQSGQSPTVMLSEELEAVRMYLSMEKIRFEERLNVRFSIEAGLDEIAIPPMALQTLVENALKHGLETSIAACEISISAIREGDKIKISVTNQGKLSGSSNSTQLGLKNTEKRLTLLFGTSASCTLTEAGGVVIATLALPGVKQ